jgi:cobalt ECF transporter T component CbiQ
MKHDFIDHHRVGSSLIHKLDPRAKLLIMLLYIAAVIILPLKLEISYIFLGVLPIILALLSEVSFWHYLTKLLKMYPMIFFLFVFIPFLPADQDISYRFGLINIYSKGLGKFFYMNAKAFIIMFMTVVLTSTTDFSMLLKGMEKLKMPRLTIAVLSFMYRFIFLFIDEIERMSFAFQSRYIHLPFRTRLGIHIKQFGTFFIKIFERGERVYQSMESRGFRGVIYTINDLHWTLRDSFLVATFIFFLLITFAI